MPGSEQVAALLIDVEAELRQLDRWQDVAPSRQALASSEPFCVDTLSFTQWLQFVFLPSMHQLIVSRAPLPTECGVAPMAEEHFDGLGLPSTGLEKALLDLDQLLSGSQS